VPGGARPACLYTNNVYAYIEVTTPAA